MITEQDRINMYGNMTEEEINLVYKQQGNYRGWICAFIGDGSVIMQKKNHEIRAHRGWEFKNWIPECWIELKERIDKLEN